MIIGLFLRKLGYDNWFSSCPVWIATEGYVQNEVIVGICQDLVCDWIVRIDDNRIMLFVKCQNSYG